MHLSLALLFPALLSVQAAAIKDTRSEAGVKPLQNVGGPHGTAVSTVFSHHTCGRALIRDSFLTQTSSEMITSASQRFQ